MQLPVSRVRQGKVDVWRRALQERTFTRGRDFPVRFRDGSHPGRDAVGVVRTVCGALRDHNDRQAVWRSELRSLTCTKCAARGSAWQANCSLK